MVAINPQTGAILAMASFPTYDPNGYATLDGTKLNKVDAANRANPSEPLLNRAIEQSYPPGSTFKIITSAAALSTGKVASQNATLPAPNSLPLGNGNTLINDGGETCGDGNPQMIQAFWLSCNTAFGKLGQQLGGATLARYANLFGANSSTLKIPLPVAASVIPTETDPAFEAFAAIGQHNDQVTPLQEAMIAATIANHGTLMTPYLVKQVIAPDGSTVQNASPTQLSQAVTAGRGQRDPGHDGAGHRRTRPAPRTRRPTRPSRASRSPARPVPRRTASTTPDSMTPCSRASRPPATRR